MKGTYLDWLKNKVEYFDGPQHNILLDVLHNIPYQPILEKDWNRYEDGISLRDEFFGNKKPDANIIDTSCSFLEFLVALARRMNYIYSYVYEDRTQDCFWMMIDNLGINYSDDNWVIDRDVVENVVLCVNERRYTDSGVGNMFPIKRPSMNQRNVEVWYQMNQYLRERMEEEGRL